MASRGCVLWGGGGGWDETKKKKKKEKKKKKIATDRRDRQCAVGAQGILEKPELNCYGGIGGQEIVKK